MRVHPPRHPRRAAGRWRPRRRWRGRRRRSGVIRGDGPVREPEPLGRRAAAAGLMRPGGVVLGHPPVQRRLQFRQGGELPVVRGEELRPHRPVAALTFPVVVGEYGLVEQVLNPVISADPVEHDRARPAAEPRGEHLAVIGQDLLRHPMAAQRPGQRQAHRPGRGPQHHLRAHDEPGVVIDAGHDLDLGAAGQVHPAHHVHLPQLHRPAPLPAPVILPPPLALLRIHQAMPDQRPVHRRPPRQRHHPRPLQLPADPRRPPPRMIPPHAHDPRLHRGGHLMRARRRPRRPVRQPAQAARRIAGQPLMHRLPRHTMAAGHLGNRQALLQDLQHRPVPLLHHTQLHQHTRPLSPRSAF